MPVRIKYHRQNRPAEKIIACRLKEDFCMVTEEWAKHIFKTRFEHFDKETVTQAKNRIIDTIGCTIGGANASGNSILLDLIKRWGGKKEATILVDGGKAPAHNAAWLNSIMARSFDFGIVIPYIGDRAVPAHITESTVPTAVTMAEWQRASGKELLTALILGEDITIRVSAASKYIPGTGWDTPGIVDKFGTAAIAAKLLGLNEKQTVNALGIVIDQLAGSFQSINDGAHSFKLGQGLAARDGIISAEMAQKGWVGAKDPLLGKYGYFALYCQCADQQILTAKLGEEFYGGRCTYKPYPGCGFTHSPIDCALEITNAPGFDIDQVEEITINVAPMHVGSTLDRPFTPGDFPQGNASFSFRYAVSNALLRKSARPEHYTEQYVLEPAVGELIRKCRVISTMTPADRNDAAEVKVKMKGGREFTARARAPKGNPLFRPLTRDEIIEKYRNNVAFSKTVSGQNAEKALDMIDHLENVADTSELVSLLVAPAAKNRRR
jgi:2-methylcitrate dehydratase PrpD